MFFLIVIIQIYTSIHFDFSLPCRNSLILCVCVCVSCFVVSDSATPQTTAPPGPSVHGILQARTLEWVTVSSSKRNYRKKESEVTQSCPTLCDPMDCSLPGSPIHGIFQARVLEWVAISLSKQICCSPTYLFWLSCLCFWCIFQKTHCQDQGQGGFPLCFLLGVSWFQILLLIF